MECTVKPSGSSRELSVGAMVCHILGSSRGAAKKLKPQVQACYQQRQRKPLESVAIMLFNTKINHWPLPTQALAGRA
jgi:hypothetical protein